MKRIIILWMLVLGFVVSAVNAQVISPKLTFVSMSPKALKWQEYKKGISSAEFYLFDLGKDVYVDQVSFTTFPARDREIYLLKDDVFFLVKKMSDWGKLYKGRRVGDQFVIDLENRSGRYLIVRSEDLTGDIVDAINVIQGTSPQLKVSSPVVEQIGDGVVISFNSNLDLQSQVVFEEEMVFMVEKKLSRVRSNIGFSKEHRFEIKPLKKGTIYWYVLLLKDKAGKSFKTKYYKFIKE